MKTENHEVIFAIVNAGFAEDVMDVARENGARGGTILNARGVVKEDTAHFFGITVHADKEILMMVVEKTIRDRVLNVIYKEMGMAKKVKGIAFSLPVSDVAGLAVPEPKKKGMISIKKHPKGCFFAARITNNGSKGKNPSYSSFRANAVSRGIFPSGRFYLVLVLFCHVRGFLHSAGAKGLKDVTGAFFVLSEIVPSFHVRNGT